MLSDPSLDKPAETKLTRRIFLPTVVLSTWHPQIPLRSAAIAWPQAILTVQSFCGQECSHPRQDVESWNSTILENDLMLLPTSACLCKTNAAVSANRLHALLSSSFALVRQRRLVLASRVPTWLLLEEDDSIDIGTLLGVRCGSGALGCTYPTLMGHVQRRQAFIISNLGLAVPEPTIPPPELRECSWK